MGQAKTQFSPLLKAAKKSHSDALILIQDGDKIIDYHRGSKSEKIESMSVTKSIVGLAIARLLTENKIDSLNTPVAHYYPEWRQGQKKNITIRHLMNHTSGLQNVPNTRVEIQPSADFLQLALSASVVDTPGTKFSYNNKAVNILSGIVRKASGQTMDDYLRDGLFKQMDITDFNWRADDAGHSRAMAGFQVRPEDLAKLGELVLHKGSWRGRPPIVKKWMDKLLARGSTHTIKYGLLWWRIPSGSKHVIDDEHIQVLKEAGFDPDLVNKLKKIKGSYESQSAAVQALMSQFSRREMGRLKKTSSEKGLPPWKASNSGQIAGYKAEGYLGQYLVVFPKQRLVAVRMVKNYKDYDMKTDSFSNFTQMVYKLATTSSPVNSNSGK